MSRWRAAKGRTKSKQSKAGAVGCVLAIALALLFFIWSFSALVRP